MLTETTTQIAMALCNQVRVLTTAQLAAHWFSHLKRPNESARRAARKLVTEGLATSMKMMLTSVSVDAPLLTWTPGAGELPNFGRLAAVNYKRWQQPPEATTLLTATNAAHGLFAGTPRQLRSRDLEHDCTVSSVWASLSEGERSTWQLEDSLPAGIFGRKRPDAVLMGTEMRVLDVVGRGYSQAKLQTIVRTFEHCYLELR